MFRYLVERRFANGLHIPISDAGAAACRNIVDQNASLGVTWLHSYVSEDKQTTFCLYEAPNPEAVRQAAARCGLPVDRITKVTRLDPYFYR
jgi:uncharacterized protein DUF4242